MRQINIQVDDRVYGRLVAMAGEHKVPTSTYARMLFEAAYAARFGKSGDVDLDNQVATTVVLFAARQNSADIAKVVKLKEETIVRIIDAWRTQRGFA